MKNEITLIIKKSNLINKLYKCLYEFTKIYKKNMPLDTT